MTPKRVRLRGYRGFRLWLLLFGVALCTAGITAQVHWQGLLVQHASNIYFWAKIRWVSAITMVCASIIFLEPWLTPKFGRAMFGLLIPKLHLQRYWRNLDDAQEHRPTVKITLLMAAIGTTSLAMLWSPSAIDTIVVLVVLCFAMVVTIKRTTRTYHLSQLKPLVPTEIHAPQYVALQPSVLPWEVDFGTVHPGRRSSCGVMIHNHSSRPLDVSLRSNQQWVLCGSERLRCHSFSLLCVLVQAEYPIFSTVDVVNLRGHIEIEIGESTVSLPARATLRSQNRTDKSLRILVDLFLGLLFVLIASLPVVLLLISQDKAVAEKLVFAGWLLGTLAYTYVVDRVLHIQETVNYTFLLTHAAILGCITGVCSGVVLNLATHALIPLELSTYKTALVGATAGICVGIWYVTSRPYLWAWKAWAHQ